MPRNDLRRQAGRVARRPHGGDLEGQDGDQGAADGDQDIGAQPGFLVRQLPLHADDPSQHGRQQDL